MTISLFSRVFSFHMDLIRDEGSISVFPYMLAITVLIALFFIRKQDTRFKKVCIMLLAGYFLILINKTIFPIFISGSFVDIMRNSPDMRYVEWLPFFMTLRTDQPLSYYLPFVLNVLLTVPLGFLLSCLLPGKMNKALFFSFLVVTGIETTQLIISLILRYPHRIFDINDVFLNMAGALLGYGPRALMIRFAGSRSAFMRCSKPQITQNAGETITELDVKNN